MDAVEVAVATRVRAGQPVSGDRSIVVRGESAVLVGVVDGVGHGARARAAATEAAREVARAGDEPLPRIFARVHELLAGTRGAVMSVARIALDGRVSWLGIGNVRGVVVPAADIGSPRADLLLVPGILGRDLPALRPDEIELRRHDTLILATDGVRDAFAERLRPDAPPRLAQRLVAGGGDADDALVLVARWAGERSWPATRSW